MKELLGKIDNDEDWYPGKQYGEQRGRKLMDQAWPDLDFATQAVVVVVVGGDAGRVRTSAEGVG